MSNVHSINFEHPVQHKYHFSQQCPIKTLNGIAWITLILGALTLAGAILSILATRGALPHGIDQYVTFGTQHKWILLGSGSGLFVIGALGKIYIYRNGKAKENALRKSYEMNKSNRENSVEITLSLEALKKSKQLHCYTTLSICSPSKSWLVFVKQGKKYTIHHYENDACFKSARKVFRQTHQQISWQLIGNVLSILNG